MERESCEFEPSVKRERERERQVDWTGLVWSGRGRKKERTGEKKWAEENTNYDDKPIYVLHNMI